MPLKLISSQRGKPLLVIEGCIYSIHRESKDCVNWRCVQYKSSCNARCKTDTCTKRGKILAESGKHNHRPDPGAVQAKTAMQKLKARAKKTKEPTGVVVASVIKDISKADAPDCPTRNAMARAVQRVRQNEKNIPAIPRDFDSINVSGDYATTTDGVMFCYQSDRSKKYKFLMFTTSRNLSLLSQSELWFADGTFYVVPKLFYQLYTFHGLYKGDVLPLVYVLAPNKSQKTYIAILNELKKLRPELKPKIVMVDFELAFHNAVGVLFPDAIVKGCLFHFCNAIWKKIQSTGLQHAYASDATYALYLKKLMALAYVPEDDVVDVYERLLKTKFYVDHEKELEKLLAYFEHTWIGELNRRGERGDGVFDRSVWNHFSSVKLCHPTTNNSVEGWHNSFNQRAGKAHVSLWDFIELLQGEQAVTEYKVAQLDAGGKAQGVKRKKYLDKGARLFKVISGYSRDHVMSYLRSLAHNIIQ